MATENTIKKSELYSDFRTDFAVHPINGDLLRLTNEDAVMRSIKNLLLTAATERHWNPDFGSGLAAYLFEPISVITEAGIKQSIELTVKNYEPRAQLISVQVSARPDDNAYVATIVFAVINRERPVTFSVLLNRIR